MEQKKYELFVSLEVYYKVDLLKQVLSVNVTKYSVFIKKSPSLIRYAKYLEVKGLINYIK